MSSSLMQQGFSLRRPFRPCLPSNLSRPLLPCLMQDTFSTSQEGPPGVGGWEGALPLSVYNV